MSIKTKNITFLSAQDCISKPIEQIGGKAKGLAFLLEQHLKTPSFYVIDFDSIQLLLQDSQLLKTGLIDWQKKNNISSTDFWAVRSSAANEDGADKSFAGQFTSVLHVKFEELEKEIRKVIDSYQRNTTYSEKAKTFGVIIQKMVNARFSGVLFSKDPILEFSNQPVIAIIPGIGDKLVSGELDGYSIHFKEGIPIFNDENKIEGENFKNGHRNEIISTSNEIRDAINPHISEMISIATRLEKSQNCALDFEFALQDEALFWLQIRPITTRALHPKVEIWDNTSAEANYPGTTLPLTISFVKNTFFQAYGSGAKELGFNPKVLKTHRHLLANMSGAIDGALYYNVTAWQTLIYLMPFGRRLSKKLPTMWGMEKTAFQIPEVQHLRLDKCKIVFRIIVILVNAKRYEKEYLNLFQHHIGNFDNQSIQHDSLEELKDKYLTIEKEFGRKWLAPVLNGFNTMLIFTLLKRKIRRSKIETDYPNFMNDMLFSEGEVKSVQLVRQFQLLLEEIVQSNELNHFFTENKAIQIWHQIPFKFKEFHQKIENYILEFGNRSDQGELKLETINYSQNPVLFIHSIQTSLKGFKPIERSTKRFDYKSIIIHNYPINFLQRWWLNKLIRSAIKRMKARENYRFIRTDTFAVIRTLFLQMGNVLKAENSIENARDVLYLEMDELFDLSLKKDFKTLIEKRKKIYAIFEKKQRCNRYVKVNQTYFAIHSDTVQLEGNSLKGIACCSGIVTQKVIIIDENTDFNQDFSNRILVAEYFEPGWVNLFYQAKGIISERGNLLSHTAIISRELNLPSIVGAKGVVKIIKTGDIVTMDGELGIITILENE